MKWLILGLFLLTGCGAKRGTSESTFQQKETTYQVTLLFDMSGSFSHMMAEDGKAYEFALQVIDKYFRDRIGMEDELIIAKIAGSSRALLWQGTPQQLRQDFPTASAFREMLYLVDGKASEETFLKVTDANGKVFIGASNIHQCMSTTLRYAISEPGIKDGRVKSAVFICSDMIDSDPKNEQSKQDSIESIKAYGQAGGTVGIYFVDQGLVSEWRKILEESGTKEWRVESEIVSRPILPQFE